MIPCSYERPGWTRREVLGAGLLFLVYVVAYYGQLDRKIYFVTAVDPATSRNVFDIRPAYHFRALERFFEPMHHIDRFVRSDYWSTIENDATLRKWTNPAPSKNVTGPPSPAAVRGLQRGG
jgi:hypothetical protein